MTINVLKSNGVTEPLDLGKILRWSEWAAKDCLDIPLEGLVTEASPSFYDGMTTAEITTALCKKCETLADIASKEGDFHIVEQYFNIARNLYLPSLIKKIHKEQAKVLSPDDYLSVHYTISENNVIPLLRPKFSAVVRLNIENENYDPELLDGSIHPEIFEYADSLINYTDTLDLYFNGLTQLEKKYLIAKNGIITENPLEAFMAMALALTHSDVKTYPNGSDLEFQKEALLNYYLIISRGEMNVPTPFYVGIRSPDKQYDSCCLFSTDDTNDSIEQANRVAQRATVSGAGLGGSLGRIRAKGRPYRKGRGEHAGLLGYLGALSKIVKGSNQVSRGGSATINFPIWHRDFFDLVMLKDISGIEGENRYRHLDYSFHYSEYLLDKLFTNGKILLPSPDIRLPDGRTVYEAFYNTDDNGMYDDKAFIAFCEKTLLDPSIPYINASNTTTAKNGETVYTTAYDLFSVLADQIMSNGRMYTLNVTHTNDHSSYLQTIEMSNLCHEITQPTVPVTCTYDSKTHTDKLSEESEVSFCQLGAIVLGKIKYEDIPRVTYWIARLQEAVFNISDYSVIPFSHRQKKRRNIGIGIVNIQHLLAKEVYSKFPEKDWVTEAGRTTHKWTEAIQYYLLEASSKLAETLGPCELYNLTKYSKGIFPVDTYTKTPLTDFSFLLDWSELKARVKITGLRFSTNTAVMPAESSSVVFSLINGIEFPRNPVVFKGNKHQSVAVAVPEIAKYGKYYVYAWGKYTKFTINELYLSIAANISKFIDQAISFNTYFDFSDGEKISEMDVFRILFVNPSKAGIKTTYYANFNVDRDEEADEKTDELTEEMSEEEKEFFRKLKEIEAESGCAGGSCTL